MRAAARSRAEEALAFTRDFTLDPHFAPFVREALARGDAVTVVSEGFDFYVRDQLERAGLGDLPWAANRAALRRTAAVTPEFPHAGRGCGRCGNCKGRARARLAGARLPHRAGRRRRSRTAAARAPPTRCSRAATCSPGAASEGIAVPPFEDFADVAGCRAHLRASRDGAIAAGARP